MASGLEGWLPAGITARQWRALAAAQAGFMLDAMDVLLYVFALQSIRAEFGLSHAEAGLAGSVTLIASALGGIAAGVLLDRIGRTRVLVYTILLYSFASGGTALSRGLPDLLFWRAMVGLGLGGEWSAGAVLVSETWPAEHRGKAIGFMQAGWALGYMLAAGVSGFVLSHYNWRTLFWVGVLPALATFAIRRGVPEPEIWKRRERTGLGFCAIFRPPLLRRTALATAVASAVLLGYWGLFTWVPGFLSAPVERGGAGLNLVRASAWVLPMQTGALFGYITFGFVADRFGRRPAFASYMVMAALLTPIYGRIPQWAGAQAETALLLIGPLVGFFGSGYFSLFGAMLAELYPTAVRGAGQGFSYNAGRALGAIAPYWIGFWADRGGLGAALGWNAAFFLLGAVLIFALPETRAAELSE